MAAERPAGRLRQDAVRERVGVLREDTVRIERLGDRTAHQERRVRSRVRVDDLIGVRIGRIAGSRVLRCRAPRLVADGVVPVSDEAHVAVPRAADEGRRAVPDDVARLGAEFRRVVGMPGIAVRRREVAHRHEGVREAGRIVEFI